MASSSKNQTSLIEDAVSGDLSRLGKLYRLKRSDYEFVSVGSAEARKYLDQGWEVEKELRTKTTLRKLKHYSQKFLDDVWCQMYDLGYRMLSITDDVSWTHGSKNERESALNVIAVDKETVLFITCRSNDRPKKPTFLKSDLSDVNQKIPELKRAAVATFGKGLKFRYIYATRNLRIDPDGDDIKKLRSAGGFFYNDNTFEYLKSIIKNYKDAAHFQFMGILFRGQSVGGDVIRIPAVEGFMGNKRYFMFSINPQTLLKIGFILHRTRANESEMPTYQRLLVPSRLQGINKFLNGGGYFPNSIIVNFKDGKKLKFESSVTEQFGSRAGLLSIPNSYAIAYIIDGQHRVYGYAGTSLSKINTIPVVAFTDLKSVEQLEIFMSINENQKSVSPSLRGTLERDLYWESDRVDTRLKALRSSIVIELCESINGPLFNKIEIGEDEAPLKFAPFSKGLLNSGLLPKAVGNKYTEESLKSCLYNAKNSNYNFEMSKSKKDVVMLLNLCFGHVEESYPSIFDSRNSLIVSNRGVFAFICLIGSLNSWETEETKKLSITSSVDQRFSILLPYLDSLLKKLLQFDKEEEEAVLGSYGTGGDIVWLRTFQLIVNDAFPLYNPVELVEWKERKDEALQDRGRKAGVEIERHIKKNVLKTLKQLFDDDWELEISSIKRKCAERAEEERERQYKEGFGNKDIPWTSMFTIMDYSTIIEKFWTKDPRRNISNFTTFAAQFSIDIGEGLSSKTKATKWISRFNSLRNNWAHEGTKDKGLSQDEVNFLQTIHSKFYP